jgi:hypothetical protein
LNQRLVPACLTSAASGNPNCVSARRFVERGVSQGDHTVGFGELHHDLEGSIQSRNLKVDATDLLDGQSLRIGKLVESIVEVMRESLKPVAPNCAENSLLCLKFRFLTKIFAAPVISPSPWKVGAVRTL